MIMQYEYSRFLLFAYLDMIVCIPFTALMFLAFFRLHAMFAEKYRQMNQCIINVVERSIFIVLGKIIREGNILVWGMDKEFSLLVKKDIVNTNFIKLDIDDYKGKVKIKIQSDKEKISRIINV